MSTNKRLTRSTSDRTVAGVCGGLGEYFGVDPTFIRLGFALLAVLGGPGVLLYIILWIVMPEGRDTDFEWEDYDNGIVIEEPMDFEGAPKVKNTEKLKNDDL